MAGMTDWWWQGWAPCLRLKEPDSPGQWARHGRWGQAWPTGRLADWPIGVPPGMADWAIGVSPQVDDFGVSWGLWRVAGGNSASQDGRLLAKSLARTAGCLPRA